MKSLKYGLSLVIAANLFIGCAAKKFPVKFDSNPTGAVLVCNGQNYGYTPLILEFDPKIREYGTFDVSRCSANWVSGYKISYPSMMKIFPEGTTTTVQRPMEGEGYQKDLAFSLEVEKLRLQQSQAQAAQLNAYFQQQQANQQALQNVNQNLNNSWNNSQMQLQNMQLQNINKNLNNINNNLNEINGGPLRPQW